jgi:hypothetical protein
MVGATMLRSPSKTENPARSYPLCVSIKETFKSVSNLTMPVVTSVFFKRSKQLDVTHESNPSWSMSANKTLSSFVCPGGIHVI